MWGFAAALLIYAGVLSILVQSALSATDLNRFSEDAAAESSTAVATDNFRLAVKESQTAVGRLRYAMLPVTVGCAAVENLPLLGPNCDGYNSLFATFDTVVLAANQVLNSADDLQAVLGDISGSWTETGNGTLEQRLDSIIADLEQSDNLITRATDMADRKPGALPVVNSMLEKGKNAAIEVKGVVVFQQVIADAMVRGIELSTQAPETIDHLKSAMSSGAGPVEIAEIWSGLRDSLMEFDRAMSNGVDSMPEVLAGSSFESRLIDAHGQIQPILRLAVAIGVGIDIFADVLHVVGDLEGSFLTGGGLAAMVDAMSDREAELDQAVDTISEISQQMSDGTFESGIIGSGASADVVSALDNNLGFISNFGNLAKLLNLLIGGTGTKQYLVLGQSPSEIRPMGGFTSSAWYLSFESGRLVDIEFVPILEFGETDVLADISSPPEPLVVYMNAGAWYLRDIGWSPSFPEVGASALKMNAAGNASNIDGVVAVNQNFLINLIASLGSVEVEGEVLTFESAEAVIQRRTDEDGTEFLQKLLRPLILGLDSVRLSSNAVQFGGSVLADLNSRDLMIFSTDPVIAEMLADFGWDGRVDIGFDDTLAVFDSNIGWNKVDTSIVRSIDHRAVVDSEGGVRSRVNLRYVNSSNSLAPGCESHSRPENTENLYSLLSEGCYWNYVRAYVPITAVDHDVPEFGVPESAVAVSSGAMIPHAPTGGVWADEVGNYMGGLMAIPPEMTADYKLEYYLPEISARSDNLLEYRLEIFAHPGLSTRTLTGTVQFPEGYVITSFPNYAVLTNGNVVTWSLPGSVSTTLQVEAEFVGGDD